MSFDDYPTTEEKHIPYKMIAIIGGGIVFAIVIVGVVIRMVQHKDEVGIVKTQIDAVSTMLDQCETAPNPESCRRQLIKETESQATTPEFCQALTGNEADGCIWKFARESMKPEFCAAIKNETYKGLCADSAYDALARSTSDITQCDNIKSDLSKRVCILALEPPITIENCSERGKPETYCQMLVVLAQANLKQDPELCKQLSDDRVLDCEDLVGIDDPDFDQLQTTDETLYGSNPRIADTDGDGFKDGDEVTSGYNPNGPGKLTQ